MSFEMIKVFNRVIYNAVRDCQPLIVLGIFVIISSKELNPFVLNLLTIIIVMSIFHIIFGDEDHKRLKK